MGTPGPPVLEKFLTEQAFWKELGLQPEVPLEARPHRELDEYALIISLYRRHEAAQRALASKNKR